MILQTLLILLKRPPPPPNRLLVVGTTAIAHLLEDVQLVSTFNLQVLLLGERGFRTLLFTLSVVEDFRKILTGGANRFYSQTQVYFSDSCS